MMGFCSWGMEQAGWGGVGGTGMAWILFNLGWTGSENKQEEGRGSGQFLDYMERTKGQGPLRSV
jgi:hypothetical protein